MKTSLYVTLFFLIVSCKDDQSVTSTPKVSQENVVENVTAESNQLESRYKGREDIVEQIYQELILNDKELTKLDAKIKDINKNTENTINEYKNILSKSENYYTEARKKTEVISDSILRGKLDSVILHSALNYDGRVVGVKNTIFQAEQNLKKINDLYAAYKIKKTLPEIEKYQKSNPFDLRKLNELIKNQNQFLTEINALK